MKNLISSLAGYKTYFLSLSLASAVSGSMAAGSIKPENGILYILSCLIIMALRSALKTERGKLTQDLASKLLSQAPEKSTAPQPDVDTLMSSIKNALEEVLKPKTAN